MNCQPRNDYVLILITKKPIIDGICYPDNSPLSKNNTIEAIGPDVENLNVGDVVQVIGQYKVDWDFLPGTNDLFLTQEKFVPLVYLED